MTFWDTGNKDRRLSSFNPGLTVSRISELSDEKSDYSTGEASYRSLPKPQTREAKNVAPAERPLCDVYWQHVECLNSLTQKLMRQNKLIIVLRINLEIVYYAALDGETNI